MKANQKTVITIKNDKKKISLTERFENYKENNLAKEYKWDKSKGREMDF